MTEQNIMVLGIIFAVIVFVIVFARRRRNRQKNVGTSRVGVSKPRNTIEK